MHKIHVINCSASVNSFLIYQKCIVFVIMLVHICQRREEKSMSFADFEYGVNSSDGWDHGRDIVWSIFLPFKFVTAFLRPHSL